MLTFKFKISDFTLQESLLVACIGFCEVVCKAVYQAVIVSSSKMYAFISVREPPKHDCTASYLLWTPLWGLGVTYI